MVHLLSEPLLEKKDRCEWEGLKICSFEHMRGKRWRSSGRSSKYLPLNRCAGRQLDGKFPHLLIQLNKALDVQVRSAEEVHAVISQVRHRDF